MRRTIRLTERELKHMISESVRRILREDEYDWYDEEDFDGNTGEEGQIRSYDVGYYTIDQAEQDAQENGYNDVAEYLKYWFSEVQPECPWTWQDTGGGYGYNGDTVFEEEGVVCKDIYGQLMFDEYPTF